MTFEKKEAKADQTERERRDKLVQEPMLSIDALQPRADNHETSYETEIAGEGSE